MDQFSFHSRKMLLEAVRSAEDAAIQLRQYAAATLPPVWEIPEISGDAGFPASIEITAEGWLRMELPCVMPRREDNDRSRLLAGLLRNAIHRHFRSMISRDFTPAYWCMSTSTISAKAGALSTTIIWS